MTYRVRGEAHGTWIDEGGFRSMDEACDWASRVIDGDTDSTVEVEPEA